MITAFSKHKLHESAQHCVCKIEENNLRLRIKNEKKESPK